MQDYMLKNPEIVSGGYTFRPWAHAMTNRTRRLADGSTVRQMHSCHSKSPHLVAPHSWDCCVILSSPAANTTTFVIHQVRSVCFYVLSFSGGYLARQLQGIEGTTS